MDYSEMTLEELFAAADAIPDHRTEKEIAAARGVIVEHIAFEDKSMLSYDLVDKYDGRVMRTNIPSYDLACAIRAERSDEANLRIVCRKEV